jgi:formate--tetrahydrofolate ligase
MAALLRDAIHPNLVQTLEGTPALVHGGPFANIAHGCNSVIATRLGLKLGEICVTEAGFGFDLGAEKFLDIKCGYAGLGPDGVVLVATARALKYHGGVPMSAVDQEDLPAIARGMANLEKHVETARLFGLPVVVALNRFPSDTDRQLQAIVGHCADLGVQAVPADVFGQGGVGGEALAAALVDLLGKEPPTFRPLYDWSAPVKAKIEAIATKAYGAAEVVYSKRAEGQIAQAEALGHAGLPICMAKTQRSLSDDPARLGRPRGFPISVGEVRISAGAGFLVPITGDMLTMPGLPRTPSAERVDVDADGRISGLG